MKTVKHTFVALTAVALLSAPAFALAQDPPSPAQPPSSPRPAGPPPSAQPPMASDTAKALKAEGELVKVDADAKTITIKGDAGADQTFTYTDATDVKGAREGVAGLATKSGSKVKVEYKDAGGVKTATKIEVQGGAGSQ
jgi:hypothetical protein